MSTRGRFPRRNNLRAALQLPREAAWILVRIIVASFLLLSWGQP